MTLRLGFLHALQEIGVPVWNGARSIERCVDKSATSFLLARAGLPTPMTWVTESREAAAEVVRREAGPIRAQAAVRFARARFEATTQRTGPSGSC